MTHPARDPAILDAVALLNGYGFDMDGFAADYLVSYWAVNHPAHWIRAAIVEALYQGRYRAVSVGQILAVWRRRGQPILHYTPDFERVVSGRFGGFAVASSAGASVSPAPVSQLPASQTPDRQNQSSPALSSEAALDEISGERRSVNAETPADRPESIAAPPVSGSQSDLQSAYQSDPQPASQSSSVSAADDDQSDASGPTKDEDSFGWWGRGSVAQNPIHQYVPIIPRIEASAFYAKLRAVACGGDEAGEAGAVLVADSQRLVQSSMLRNSPLLDSMEQAQLGEQN